MKNTDSKTLIFPRAHLKCTHPIKPTSKRASLETGRRNQNVGFDKAAGICFKNSETMCKGTK